MEPILAYVKRRLLEVGSSEWESIRAAAGGAKSVPRKLAYDRENTSINGLEPYYRYFLLRDYGLAKLPHENGPITKRGR